MHPTTWSRVAVELISPPDGWIWWTPAAISASSMICSLKNFLKHVAFTSRGIIIVLRQWEDAQSRWYKTNVTYGFWIVLRQKQDTNVQDTPYLCILCRCIEAVGGHADQVIQDKRYFCLWIIVLRQWEVTHCKWYEANVTCIFILLQHMTKARWTGCGRCIIFLWLEAEIMLAGERRGRLLKFVLINIPRKQQHEEERVSC